MQALYVYSKSRLSTVDVMLLLIGARDLSSLLTIAGSFSLANAIEQSTVDGAGRSSYSCHPESKFWWCISTSSTTTLRRKVPHFIDVQDCWRAIVANLSAQGQCICSHFTRVEKCLVRAQRG
jgi:hypothetical protein